MELADKRSLCPSKARASYKPTTTVEMTEGKTKMNNKHDHSTNVQSQRKRILNWLKTKPLTTLQARTELDVMHPAARVQELKAQGNNICTHWETVDTGKAKHRVASYVLLMES